MFAAARRCRSRGRAQRRDGGDRPASMRGLPRRDDRRRATSRTGDGDRHALRAGVLGAGLALGVAGAQIRARARGAGRRRTAGGVLEPARLGSLRAARRAAQPPTRARPPDFGPDPGPLHPGSEIAPDRWEDWDARDRGGGRARRPAYALLRVERRVHRAALRGADRAPPTTTSCSPTATRQALLEAVGGVIERQRRLAVAATGHEAVPRARERATMRARSDSERRRHRARRRRRRAAARGATRPPTTAPTTTPNGACPVDDDVGCSRS